MINPVNPVLSPVLALANTRLQTEGRLLLEASVLPARLPPLKPGEEVVAQVAERLDGQRFVAVIKDSLFTLDLPARATLKSDMLTLRVAGTSPLTFALVGAAEPEALPGKGLTAVTLSPASRYLTELLTASRDPLPQLRPGSQAATGNASAPLMLLAAGAETHSPVQLAEALKNLVSRSGLFYESHLKSWLEGKLPLSSLRAEPQARLMPSSPSGLQKFSFPSLFAEPEVVDTPGTLRPASDTVRAAANEMGQLVQRQLDTLEQHTLTLALQPWPGAAAALSIAEQRVEEREANGQQGGEPAERSWQTQLALQLPKLGGINANLTLGGGTLQLRFHADDPTTVALIREHQERLQSSLAAAGLSLSLMTVNDEHKPG
ncbi:flagellar hook-length control protein FliK [Crenobacter sp. SG2305]|uniref:flagellar hook-length control protein FliK n=1 Tax=Crenobacter oryzisoli TaxID=3056844 RepID=UPI0025AB4327|nr:flagellar hook-length control protein FliK [Crenobacter sp. SG2305]MDN0082642.1 flagellar hook-length control protein FliK [Crenobacter sp. SG2305]